MDNCEYFQGLISRLLDDDLTAAEQAAVQEHIRLCPDCAQVYDAFCQMRAAIGGDAMVEPPPALARGVMDRVAAHSHPAPVPAAAPDHRLRSWKKLAAAACFVALVAAGAVTGVFGRGARMAGAGEAADYLPEAQSDTIYVRLPEDAGQPAEAAGAGSAENRAFSGAADSAAPEAGAAQNTAQSAASAPRTAPETAETAEEGAMEDAVEASDDGIMAVMEPPQAAADSAPLALPVQGADGADAGVITDTAALRALLTGEALDGPLPAPDYTLSLDGEDYAFAGDGDGGLLWWRAGDAGPTRSPAALTDLEALLG